MRWIAKICLWSAAALLLLACAATAFVFYEGRQTPTGKPVYVALGSSYAAGAGLGRLQSGSPLLCARSVAGYPQQLANALGVSIVDMTCGGATTANVLNGGQFFQGPQIRTITARTRLVTITSGGNDVNFIGDLSMLALRQSGGVSGWLAARLWDGPKAASRRDYGRVHRTLRDLIHTIRQRAPNARIVIVTYPTILPRSGTCSELHLTNAEADAMRAVERDLAAVTRDAAKEGGATLVDMNMLGADHNACAATPWTRGMAALSAAPFHPTLAGAKATAAAIADALRRSPTGVAAVR